jgi:arginase family enzyme
MIDPLTRWAAYGEKPDYAGLMTYAGLPYTEDPAELEGVDVAIVGAPMDELTSDSPGTRFGPRAIRAASCAPGPHLEEPGGMTSADLLWACREIGASVQLVGTEVVEVLPDRIGSRDITALVAERIVRETLTGVALARVREPAASVA